MLNKFMLFVVACALMFIVACMIAESSKAESLINETEMYEMMRVTYIYKTPQEAVGKDGMKKSVIPITCVDANGWGWEIVDFAADLGPVKVGDRVYITKGTSIQPDTNRLLVHWIRIDYVIKKEDMD